MSWNQVLNCQICNQFLKCHLSLCSGEHMLVKVDINKKKQLDRFWAVWWTEQFGENSHSMSSSSKTFFTKLQSWYIPLFSVSIKMKSSNIFLLLHDWLLRRNLTKVCGKSDLRYWGYLNKSGQFGPKKRTKFELVFLWIDFQFYSVSVTSDCENIIDGAQYHYYYWKSSETQILYQYSVERTCWHLWSGPDGAALM